MPYLSPTHIQQLPNTVLSHVLQVPSSTAISTTQGACTAADQLLTAATERLLLQQQRRYDSRVPTSPAVKMRPSCSSFSGCICCA
jgi:hypothetical protein